MREVRIHVARMHLAAVAHELQHRLGALVRRRRQQARAFARVHQRRHAAADETVVDEEVLFDRQRRVEPLEVAGAIALDAMAQREVLRACRRADRIGLHEPEALERRGQAGGSELAGDGQPAEVVERTHSFK